MKFFSVQGNGEVEQQEAPAMWTRLMNLAMKKMKKARTAEHEDVHRLHCIFGCRKRDVICVICYVLTAPAHGKCD